ncbi:hypothetical protein [Paramuribaculum intestinale]|nr:hypothetical protein [Paramuribaculum intestinale]
MPDSESGRASAAIAKPQHARDPARATALTDAYDMVADNVGV